LNKSATFGSFLFFYKQGYWITALGLVLHECVAVLRVCGFHADDDRVVHAHRGRLLGGDCHLHSESPTSETLACFSTVRTTLKGAIT
jgi:hypothetical protein